MKSIEVKFNEALAALKEVSAKNYEKVVNTLPKCSSIEAKLNCVYEALAPLTNCKDAHEVAMYLEKGDKLVAKSLIESNSEDFDEAKRDYALLFDVEPRQKATTTTKESKPTIKKNNGAAETFVEGSPFNGDRSMATAKNNTSNPYAKGDKAMFDGWLKLGKITEAEHRKLTGEKPEGYEKLSEQQRKDFDFSRAIGLSESDAFKLVRMTGTTLKEVSRR